MLFLLEELALRLREQAQPRFLRLDEAFLQLLIEIERWVAQPTS